MEVSDANMLFKQKIEKKGSVTDTMSLGKMHIKWRSKVTHLNLVSTKKNRLKFINQ